ncbi:MAG: hypothetical protein M3461_17770 [Pseudomonadota bacterium]|nr:hypothetical protein [Pseudomonadota bacterium]
MRVIEVSDEGDQSHRLATAGAPQREDLHPRRAKQAHPWAWLIWEKAEKSEFPAKRTPA